MTRTTTPGEAAVTINGKPLSLGQVMALRVAVTNYLHEMLSELGEALGDEQLRDAYRLRLQEVVIMLTEQPKEPPPPFVKRMFKGRHGS